MDFEDLTRRYSLWRTLYTSGEISYEEFVERLHDLTIEDEHGEQWRIDIDSGQWQHHVGNGWQTTDAPPSGIPTPEPLPDAPQLHPSAALASSEVIQAGGITRLQDYWGWAAIVVAVLVLALAILMLARWSTGPGSQARGAATRPPIALDRSSQDTPAPTATPQPTNTPTPTDIPEPSILDDGLPMLLIPAGPFTMGSSPDDIETAYALCETVLTSDECAEQGFESEMPQHEVVLNSFYIDQFEVTNSQFASFLNAMGNQSEGGTLWLDAGDEDVRLALQDGEWRLIDSAFGDHPVTEVTWFAAQAFCKWRGGRLPTEAEWEKAARWDPISGGSYLYPWGDESPSPMLANFSGDIGRPTKIGSYPGGVSPSGVYDMAGNVFEWVADWYTPDYYALSPELNPLGAEDGVQKVVRGGSWGDFGFLLRAANRGILTPEAAFNFIGFRCARDV